MKTGNTKLANVYAPGIEMPQWSPVMKTGNTIRPEEITNTV